MTYVLRLEMLRLIEIIRGMLKSEASCVCGRHYRLTFDGPTTILLDKIEAIIKAEPEMTRNQLIEID